MTIPRDLDGAFVEFRGQIKLTYLPGLHVAAGSDPWPIISLPPASGGHITSPPVQVGRGTCAWGESAGRRP